MCLQKLIWLAYVVLEMLWTKRARKIELSRVVHKGRRHYDERPWFEAQDRLYSIFHARSVVILSAFFWILSDTQDSCNWCRHLPIIFLHCQSNSFCALPCPRILRYPIWLCAYYILILLSNVDQYFFYESFKIVERYISWNIFLI